MVAIELVSPLWGAHRDVAKSRQCREDREPEADESGGLGAEHSHELRLLVEHLRELRVLDEDVHGPGAGREKSSRAAYSA